MSVYHNVSFYDLLQYPLFKMAAKQDDKELMKKIFWEAGIDTTQEWSLHECNHRPVTSKQPWYGLRVEGFERLDKEYLASGLASFEAKTYTKDASLRLTLLQLDPRNSVHKKKPVDDDVECSVEVFDAGEDCV
jgi:hypothetical protein